MKLGQGESVCLELVVGGEGLGLLASLLSPAPLHRALWSVLLTSFALPLSLEAGIATHFPWVWGE